MTNTKSRPSVRSPHIVCLGQFTADVVTKPVESLPEEATFVDDIALHNGGCACNTAVALGKLGVNTTAVGKVGRDAFGDFLIRRLEMAGVDTIDMVQDPNESTSATVVLVDREGERSFLHFTGANAALNEEDVPWDVVEKADLLHIAAAFLLPGLDGEPMARVLKRAQEAGVLTSLDVSWDAQGRWMEVLEPCLSHVNVFLPNFDEARELADEAAPEDVARALSSRGVDVVVIKMGSGGSYVWDGFDGEFASAFRVDEVVDTVGAGDAFNAGFLAGYTGGWHLQPACRLGNAVGAHCVNTAGASVTCSLDEILDKYPDLEK